MREKRKLKLKLKLTMGCQSWGFESLPRPDVPGWPKPVEAAP